MSVFCDCMEQKDRRGNGLFSLLVVANISCFIGSLGLIITGSTILLSKSAVLHPVVPLLYYESSAYLLVLVGIFLAVITSAGFIGQTKRNALLLVCYIIVLGFCFLVLLASTVLGMLANTDSEITVNTWLNSSLHLYGKDEQVANSWDDLQTSFQCCGIVEYTDWNKDFQWQTLPGSCCSVPEMVGETFICDIGNATGLFWEGCSKKISETVKQHKNKILLASLLELLGLLCCVCLACALVVTS